MEGPLEIRSVRMPTSACSRSTGRCRTSCCTIMARAWRNVSLTSIAYGNGVMADATERNVVHAAWGKQIRCHRRAAHRRRELHASSKCPRTISCDRENFPLCCVRPKRPANGSVVPGGSYRYGLNHRGSAACRAEARWQSQDPVPTRRRPPSCPSRPRGSNRPDEREAASSRPCGRILRIDLDVVRGEWRRSSALVTTCAMMCRLRLGGFLPPQSWCTMSKYIDVAGDEDVLHRPNRVGVVAAAAYYATQPITDEEEREELLVHTQAELGYPRADDIRGAQRLLVRAGLPITPGPAPRPPPPPPPAGGVMGIAGRVPGGRYTPAPHPGRPRAGP